MARNANLPLTVSQASVVAGFSEILFDAVNNGQEYRVTYTKRDGSQSSAVGPITAVKGLDSTLAIMVEDDSKPYASTVNVWGILSVVEIVEA